MLVSSRTPKRPRRSPGPAAAIGSALLAVTVACTSDPAPDQPPAERSVAPVPTPLADYDTSAITVGRAAFCARVSEDAVAAAVGGETTDARDGESWRPGGRLPDGSGIGNEFGCAWTAGRVTARAWVFAPPVTPGRADDLVAEVVSEKCRRVRAADLGEPSVAQRCDRTETTGIYGLVGDAWVSCEISGLSTTSDSKDRVGEWCVAVLEALRAT